jgi:CRP-like cAMP-binding protein
MPSSKNRLLKSLLPGDLNLLQPHLSIVELSQKDVLLQKRHHVSLVYFPTSAVISLVAVLQNGRAIQTAIVGRDGVVGASPALDGELSLSGAVVQVGGAALVCAVPKFKSLVMKSPTLLSAILRHEQALYAQAQQYTACMSAHTVRQRLSQHLLRVAELHGKETLPITQDFLSEILGVRRTSVTESAVALKATGAINYSRGHLEIRNLEVLRDLSCECYETVKSDYSALTKGNDS